MIYDWQTKSDLVGGRFSGFALQTFVQGGWDFFDIFWGGVAHVYPAPAISTIDSHHTRLWHYTRDGKASFAGYSRR